MHDRNYQKIWQYIKTMKYFSVMEIYILLTLDRNSHATYEVLDEYLKHLNNFEIIKELEKDSYVLIKDLGILAPKIFDEQTIYDPNNDKIILSQEIYSTNKLNCNINNGKFLYRR